MSSKVEYIKLMWLLDECPFWTMRHEENIPLNRFGLKKAYKELNIAHWIRQFDKHYRLWLDEDLGNAHFEIRHSLNLNMIMALQKWNAQSENIKIFYWFEENRDKNPDYVWTHCPLSGKRLINLGKSFCRKNRLISPIYPIVVPDVSQDEF